MDTRDFLVPDNYADFHCKCGKCRHTCCDGWAVTFPREDYFRLLSVPCSPELRRKLDTSLHLADDPTPERYAELLPNWEGTAHFSARMVSAPCKPSAARKPSPPPAAITPAASARWMTTSARAVPPASAWWKCCCTACRR